MFTFKKGPYPASEIEPQIYNFWEDNHLFESLESDTQKEVFSITMPPPNITGVLHLGHALDLTLPDIVCRYKRMKGFNVCWFPGTDQAGLATDNKVEQMLKKEGIKKQDIGREAFIEKIWEWKKTYGSKIIEQMKLIGTSADWSKLRFTKDEEYEKAVIKAFVTYYNDGLIYRGKRMIQYCPRCKTALSDIEVEHKNVKGELVYIKYFVENSDEYIVIATTRAETMLGDTAVAVHPDDKRYKKYHGKNLILPLIGRKIPIITDEYVEIDFGTGALKITPSHDPNDFNLGKKHNLDFISVISDGLTMNKECGKYSDMTLKDARKAIKEDLIESGNFIKEEPFVHSVGHCERCKHILEPVISDQWYLKTKTIAQKGLETVENGDINFIPKRWFKVYKDWMTDIYDWCISRQIWWGIRIPVWYCKDCGEIIVSEIEPKNCPECYSKNLHQEEDVLDTWFGSALWPFACMGWPNESDTLQMYYPTSLMVVGFDIIFFWVSRMIFSSLYFLNAIPFENVYFHGLILDKSGKKMSKSSSNAIDPSSLIKEHGADSLRYTVTSYSSSSGQDIKFDLKKNKASRNFINKIWNAGNFVMENTKDINYKNEIDTRLSIWDCWIISKFNNVVKCVEESIENYSFNEASGAIYSFFWHDFCDWYLESSKTTSNKFVLRKIFALSLKLMHPIIPFVTEALWLQLEENSEESIMYKSWPTFIQLTESQNYQATSIVPQIQDTIREIRNIKSEFQLGKPDGIDIEILVLDEALILEFQSNLESIVSLARIESAKFVKKESPHFIANPVNSKVTIMFPKHLIDIKNEVINKNKKIEKLDKELQKLEIKLSNPNFIDHAPSELIEEVKSEQKEIETKKEFILDRIKVLSAN
ncbi:MAG: valine--tRNA ligase [Caldisericia bacterium]|nr:valine--tRNA ligase [Caldisericia bacterium]